MGLSMLFAATLLALQTPSAEPPAQPGPEARAGDLHVLQLWSVDQDQFMRQWQQATPPNLTTDSRTERNRPIFMFLIFGGCRADAQGNCRLTGNIEIRDPDGAIYEAPANAIFWDNQPAPNPQLLTLSPQGLGLRIEDGEKLGVYRIRVSVTDVHAGRTAYTESEITVVEQGSLGPARPAPVS